MLNYTSFDSHCVWHAKNLNLFGLITHKGLSHQFVNAEKTASVEFCSKCYLGKWTPKYV
jgi:hypothetical protein